MSVYNTTYFNEEIRDEIYKAVGPPFGFKEIFKIGVIGSARMQVLQYSKSFADFVKAKNDTVYANVALRPSGILVMLSRNHHNLSWPIPYYRLSIYKTEVVSIHAEGEFLKLRIKDKRVIKFVRKILEAKNDFLGNLS